QVSADPLVADRWIGAHDQCPVDVLLGSLRRGTGTRPTTSEHARREAHLPLPHPTLPLHSPALRVKGMKAGPHMEAPCWKERFVERRLEQQRGHRYHSGVFATPSVAGGVACQPGLIAPVNHGLARLCCVLPWVHSRQRVETREVWSA